VESIDAIGERAGKETQNPFPLSGGAKKRAADVVLLARSPNNWELFFMPICKLSDLKTKNQV